MQAGWHCTKELCFSSFQYCIQLVCNKWIDQSLYWLTGKGSLSRGGSSPCHPFLLLFIHKCPCPLLGSPLTYECISAIKWEGQASCGEGRRTLPKEEMCPQTRTSPSALVYGIKCYHTAPLVSRKSEGMPSKQPPLSCIPLPCHLCPLLKAELGFSFVIKAD